MTEAEWQAATSPAPMLEFLRGKVSERKLRLFAVACCRSIMHLCGDPGIAQAVDLGERFAEGLAVKRVLVAARKAIQTGCAATNDRLPRAYETSRDEGESLFCESRVFQAAEAVTEPMAWNAAYGASICVAHAEGISAARKAVGPNYESSEAYVAAEMDGRGRALQFESLVLRDIVGNPFRPATFSPSWRASTVVSLARQMYDSGNFDAMPILADALMDAGCDSNAILSHCRSPGLHVRGCWVVDLVLGKM